MFAYLDDKMAAPALVLEPSWGGRQAVDIHEQRPRKQIRLKACWDARVCLNTGAHTVRISHKQRPVWPLCRLLMWHARRYACGQELRW